MPPTSSAMLYPMRTAMIVIGIDCAVDPKKVGIAVGDFEGARASFARLDSAFERLQEALRRELIVGDALRS